MNGPEHIAIGVASSGLVLYGISASGTPIGWTTALAASAVVGLGSLAPDIDHPRATIGWRLPAGMLSLGLILLFMPVVFRVASSDKGMFAGVWGPLQPMTAAWPVWGGILVAVAVTLFVISAKVTSSLGHRGPVHTLLAAGGATVVAVVTCLVLGVAPWYGLLFGFGWVMHLMADATTREGLPDMLWPFVAPDSGGGLKAFGLLFIPLILFGATGWFFLARTLQASPVSPAPSATAAPATSATPDTALALERLREAAPEVASSLTHPDAPAITARGAYTSYAWQYLRKVADGVAVETITVTLDGSGRIVGVEQP
jgi:hypothetical protein